MARPQAPPLEVRRWEGDGWTAAADQVAAEEPLQLLLDGEPLSIVMRTPGHDVELALGLLLAERVIGGLDDVDRVLISAESGEQEPRIGIEGVLLESNAIDLHLRAGTRGRHPQRSFLSSSACGVCGQTTVDDLALDFPPLPVAGPRLDPARLASLPELLRQHQAVFEATGGLHAAGLFTSAGDAFAVREDIGRHNAVDKVVGRALLEGRLPGGDLVLAVSGRAGYELVQKAVAAGVPALVAVGAPSSLAVQVARRFELALCGFTRAGRFNLYSGQARVSD
jgi:FdhD protein